MTGPRCEDDMRHRFTIRPGSDSHGSHRVSAEAAILYASAARPCVAGRAALAVVGAPSPRDWYGFGGRCVFTTCRRPLGVAPIPAIPRREGHMAPLRGGGWRIGRRVRVSSRWPNRMPCRPWPHASARTGRGTDGRSLRYPVANQDRKPSGTATVPDVESAASRSGVALCPLGHVRSALPKPKSPTASSVSRKTTSTSPRALNGSYPTRPQPPHGSHASRRGRQLPGCLKAAS